MLEDAVAVVVETTAQVVDVPIRAVQLSQYRV